MDKIFSLSGRDVVRQLRNKHVYGEMAATFVAA